MSNNKAHTDLYSKAITANDLHDNGATVLMGGDIDSSKTVTNAPDLAITGAGRKAQPGPVQSAHTGATYANINGIFAKLTAGQYAVKGGNITTQLAGVAYRGLRGGGNANQIRSIHTLLTRSTVIIDSWNYATGVATINEGSPSSDDFDSGSYATPTRALPGNLIVNETGGTPSTEAYQEKTG
jgi:hypothetical protein